MRAFIRIIWAGRKLVIPILAAGAIFFFAGAWIHSHATDQDNPYLHGEQMGVIIQAFSATDGRAVCRGVLITGRFYPNNWYWGQDIGGETPPASDPQGRAAWLQGCYHGYAITKGYDNGMPSS